MHNVPAVFKMPAEISERILTMSDPIDVAAISQSCSFFRKLIHHPVDQHLWRSLFLTRFDDPRPTFTINGGDSNKYPWSSELKRRVRSETLLTRRKPFASLQPKDQTLVLRTLTDVICHFPSPGVLEHSLDLEWIERLIVTADIRRAPSNLETAELLAQLRAYYGLTREEKRWPGSKTMRTASRGYVYDLRNYTRENMWGPFFQDESRRVSWVHVNHLFTVVSMSLEDIPQLWERMRPPTGLAAMRPYSAPGKIDNPKDWAGVEGSWYRYVCFIDYRDLFAYNVGQFSTSTEKGPLNTALFDAVDFQEAIRLIALCLHITEFLPCESHPHRPIIKFTGTSQGASNQARVEGSVRMTPDGQIRWHYMSTYDGETQWCSEGVQVGAVGSAMGVIGAWSGESHQEQDPVGPFWLWKGEPLRRYHGS